MSQLTLGLVPEYCAISSAANECSKLLHTRSPHRVSGKISVKSQYLNSCSRGLGVSGVPFRLSGRSGVGGACFHYMADVSEDSEE